MIDDLWAEDRLGPVRQRQQFWVVIARECDHAVPAHALAARQGFVLTHDQARKAAVTRADIRRAVRRHEWTAPRRNVLCVLPPTTRDGQLLGTSAEIRAAAAALV